MDSEQNKNDCSLLEEEFPKAVSINTFLFERLKWLLQLIITSHRFP